MPSEHRRRAAATTVVGGSLVAGGGQLRARAIREAESSGGRRIARIPITALRGARAGRGRYALGTATGLVGAAGFGEGLHELTRKRDDPDDRPGFLEEGIHGTQQAVRDKVDNARKPAPSGVRATALGTAAGSGALGSLAAHRVLDRVARGTKLRPAVTAIAGTASGVAALPLANRATRRQGYEVTPNGVKRRKKAPVRPSRTARVVEARPGRSINQNARAEIVPSDRRFAKADPMDYPGAKLSDNQKRARVIAAGAAPIVGPAAAAAQAARMAPPDQRKSAAALQYGGFTAGGLTGAVAGSQLASRGAESNPRVANRLDRIERGLSNAKSRAASVVPGRVGDRVRAHVDPERPPGRLARGLANAEARGGVVGHAVRPLVRHPSAAALGGLSGKAVGAAAGGFLGYSEALRREHHRREELTKAENGDMPLPTRREKVQNLKRKRRNLGFSMATTATGAAGTGLFVGSLAAARSKRPGLVRHAPKLERAALGTAVGGGGLSAVNGALAAGQTRRDIHNEARELNAEDKVFGKRAAGFRASGVAMRRTTNGVLVPVRRANTVSKARPRMVPKGGFKGTRQFDSKPVEPVEPHLEADKRADQAEAARRAKAANRLAAMSPEQRRREMLRNTSGALGGAGLSLPSRRYRGISKIDTTMHHDEAKQLAAQYGTKGPLPRSLDRSTRMKAYEARYIAAGGPKGEKWQRRSDDLDHVTGAAVATGGLAAGTELASHTKRGARALGRNATRIGRRANKIGLGAAGIAAGSELAHRHAQHRAGSYRSSPAGVAASALRRMRDYSED